MSLHDCRSVNFSRRDDPRGSLSFVEGGRHVPFEIKRIFYLHNIVPGSSRGGHAHRLLHQVIAALHGSFTVMLDDGTSRKSFLLDRPDQGLHVVPGTWNELSGFSSGAVCFVLASDYFDEADYIRDYDTFLRFVGAL